MAQITGRTLAHYDERASDFWEGTRDQDVSQNIAALLQRIESAPPFELLDFGCGPGRDLKTLKALGHRATGLEGSTHLAGLARAHSGCTVLEQNFLKLDLPNSRFDGVFANAALFRVPRQELPRVLLELHAALRLNGVLFSSNPRGDGQGGWNGERYGVLYNWETWRDYMTAAGFVAITHFYRPACHESRSHGWPACGVNQSHDGGIVRPIGA